MDFLIYSRGTSEAAAADDDPSLDERHWAYMDRFADRLTARGPTLGSDRASWTGSIHVVDLPDPSAAREFVAHEPYNCAGAYERHVIWRFTNLLGRTMWQFDRAADELRFLVIARTARGPISTLPAELRERLVVYGELRDLDNDAPAGCALVVQVPTRDALDALLPDLDDGAIHDWDFGGRR